MLKTSNNHEHGNTPIAAQHGHPRRRTVHGTLRIFKAKKDIANNNKKNQIFYLGKRVKNTEQVPS